MGNKLTLENFLVTHHQETDREVNSTDHNNNLQKTGFNDTQAANIGLGVLDMTRKDGLSTQESFGRWMNYIINDSPGSIVDPYLTPEALLAGQPSLGTINGYLHESQIFNITAVSPSWALSTEETKVMFISFQIHVH